MAKAIKKKVAKKRAKVYNEKLIINGTFEDVIGLSVKDVKSKVENKEKK